MAITTATIQMRRGLMADFDPNRLFPGEWAVCTDSDPAKQVVWMCFAPGVTKRLGTLEDFKEQLDEISDGMLRNYEVILDNEARALQEGLKRVKEQLSSDLREQEKKTIENLLEEKRKAIFQFESLKKLIIIEMNSRKEQLFKEIETIEKELLKMKEAVEASYFYVSKFETELKTLFLPRIEAYIVEAEENARISKRWAIGIDEIPESATDNSKYYAEQAKEIEQVVAGQGNKLDTMVEELKKQLQDGSLKGEKGEKGDTGERGDSGIIVPLSGFYALAGDEEGNLWAHYADEGKAPIFSTDVEGNIYFEIPEEQEV